MFCLILVVLDFMWFVAEKLKCRYALYAFIHKHTYACVCILSDTVLLNKYARRLGFPTSSIFEYISYAVLLNNLIHILP